MFRGGWFVFRLIGTLLLVGFLIAGGVMLYNSGQAQGYAMGLAAGGQEQAAPLPSNGSAPYYGFAPYYGWGHPFFSPFPPIIGFFVVIGLIFLFFGVIGSIFRHRTWTHNGPWSSGPRHGTPWGPPPWAGEPQPQAPGEPAPAPGQPPSEQVK